MANFEHRAKELSERYAVIRAGLPEETNALVSTALRTHAQTRDEALTFLREALADKDDQPVASRINERIDAAAARVLQPLNTMLESVKEPSSVLRAFRDIATTEEARFFETFKRAGIGANRDDQMDRCHKLETFVADLIVKWAKITDTEKALLERERYAAALLRDTVKLAFEEAVPAWATGSRELLDKAATIEKIKKQINDRVKDKIREVGETIGLDKTDAKAVSDELSRRIGLGSDVASYVFDALKLAYDPLGGAVKTIGKVAKALTPVAQAVVDQQAGDIRQALGGAQNVIVTFSTTRREATDYVKNNGYEQAKAQYDRATRALEDCVNACGPDGLKAEAKLLADAHTPVLQNFLEMMRQRHGEFVNSYTGIFFEAVSEKTLNMLTDKPYFEEWADGIERLDMDQQLQKMYAGITDLSGDLERAFGSMDLFTGLPLEAQSMLQEMVRRIEREVKDPMTAEMRSHMKTLEAASAKKPATVAQAAIRAAKETIQKAAAGGV